MSDRPRVLVTNDDGIDAPGLLALAGALKASGRFETIVAAPAEDMSGMGSAIGRFDPDAGVDLTPVDLEEADIAFSIDGPPGLAVTAAALGAFDRSPDLVVSGINAGMNTGHSVIHSGTVGAALTARTFGLRGVAVSLAPSDPWLWATAAEVGVAAAAWMLERPYPHVLNVNVPALPRRDIKGVHWADLDEFGYIRVATADVEGQKLQFVLGRPEHSATDPASDSELVRAGYVTMTPLSTVEPDPFPDVEASEVWEP